MIRLLQSHWVVSLVGGLVYLGTTAALLSPSRFEGVLAARAGKLNVAGTEASWRYHNAEFDQWLAELKREKEALGLKEQQLRDLEGRLDAERQELSSVTQSVYRLQTDFDRNVVRIKDQEVENLKRQAKVLAGMSPEAAAGMINEMPEDDAVRILFTMKPDEASPVLEALAKMGKTEARRAASITERMRRTLPPAPNAKPR